MNKHNHILYIALLLISFLFQACKPNPPPPIERSSKIIKKLPSQHALVIGINKFPKLGANWRLEGAVNDAKILHKAFKQANVNTRVLLDEQATRAGFDRAWRSMLNKAKKGDIVILTFSGHGIQLNSDTLPLDELDGQDEALIFHDFNGKQGFITDDELYSLFEEASDYKIVVVIDACHSRGMVRGAKRQTLGKMRTAGNWTIKANIPQPMQGDERQTLQHVTHIMGVDEEILKISEVTFEGKQYGALSWYFSQALMGYADYNFDNYLSRSELHNFLRKKVSQKTNNLQKPKLLPRADDTLVLASAPEPLPPSPTNVIINITTEKTQIPSNLSHFRSVNTSSEFDLLFQINNNKITAFNYTGDQITEFSNQHKNWQRLIDKARLLKFLELWFNKKYKPIDIRLREGDELHQQGEILHFTIAPGDIREGLNALTIFNLTGNGELQLMYPLANYNDPLLINDFPYHMPAMQISPPFGGDNLVAILCKQAVTNLHQLLIKVQPNLPTPKQISKSLRGNTCQVGQYAFFSGNK
ncbi:caspase family protein [Candidatus Marithrix sp. Canyon 246]|uniref:caspase family protein n=1 Tax=Candidatus Marithrix sp. Canyon 246 TaxID=1827136 RepID=UPI0014957366|nr:caspase family protein [Candidatus Marithrix sp. Canyon 246]